LIIDADQKNKGGRMRFSLSLMLVLGLVFIACEQGEVPCATDLTVPARSFVGMLAKGDYVNVHAKFDAAMKDAMPVDQVEGAWQSLQSQVGAFVDIVGVRQVKEQGYNVVYVTCTFEKSQLDIKVVYNDKQEVSGLWFLPKQ
jgi:hypothetical protein